MFFFLQHGIKCAGDTTRACRAPEEESCDSLRGGKKNKKIPLFSVKGHVALNCFHVLSVTVDLRTEVATDNNANKTHGS